MKKVGGTCGTSSSDKKKHYSSFVKKKTESNYGNHLLIEDHHFDHNFEILYIENKARKLNLLKSLGIN